MRLPALLLALALPVGALAAPAAPAFPHANSDLAPDPDVTWGVLENGIRYAVMRNAEPPGRLSMRLHVDAGSLHEEENQRGLAHFLEHMAFNGTRNFKADELIALLQNAGIAFGADLNAYTSFDETVYMLDLPKNDSAMIDKCLTVLRDWADGMSLENAQIEKERGVILNEKRDRDSVEMRLMEEQFKAILPDALITNRFPIGTEEVISTAPRDRFVDFYSGHYTPDRMSVIVVGDIDPAAMIAKIKAGFGRMKTSKDRQPEPDLGKVTPTGLKFQAFQDDEVKSTEVGITCVKPHAPVPDTKAERTRRLPLELANAMLNRRLEILSKKEGSPVVKASASSSDFIDFVRFSGIDATAVDDRWPEALALIEQELRRALEHGFTASERAEATSKLLRSYEEEVKSKATRQSDELAMAISGSLNDNDVFTSPETDLAWLQEALPGVTPETCAAALRDVWSGDDRFVSITVKNPVPDAESAIAAAWNASRALPVTPPQDDKDATFAYAEIGAPGSVESRKAIDDLGITQLVLSNGVRVNFKATPFQKNTIHLLGRLGGGKLTLPKDKGGLDMVAAFIVNAGGLVAHSNDDLERIFAGKKLGVGFTVDDDAFTLSGKTTREDLADQLRLFCAQILFPGYRDEAERQFRKGLPIMAMQMATTPEGVFGTRGERLMKGGDPRFGLENALDLGKFTTADVKAWLEPAFKDAPLEVSIVGDFDPAALEPFLLETLGAMPARQTAKPDYTEARVVPVIPEGAHRLEYESKVPKALNVIVWPTADRSDIHLSRRLNVLGEVLGDRLRVKIREEMGDAYSPGAASSASDVWKDHGYILCYSPGDPAKAATVTAAIIAIAGELADKGATAEELGRALKPILSGIQQQRRTNDYWLGTVLARSQEKPEVLEWARELEKDFKAITVDDISTLAKQYLPASRARSIIITTPVAADANPANPPAAALKPAA